MTLFNSTIDNALKAMAAGAIVSGTDIKDKNTKYKMNKSNDFIFIRTYRNSLDNGLIAVTIPQFKKFLSDNIDFFTLKKLDK